MHMMLADLLAKLLSKDGARSALPVACFFTYIFFFLQQLHKAGILVLINVRISCEQFTK